jgi:predicted branched-subunit amino acid permease
MTASTVTADRRSVVRASLAVGAATGAYGVAFGAAGTAAGLTVWQTCALSLLMFTGGSQFALVGVIAAAGPAAGLTSGVASALMLGARNAMYGVRMAGLLQVRGLRRLLAAHLVIDESTAVAVAQPVPELSRVGFWVTGGSVFLLWNVMTLVGAAGASVLGNPETFGLDAAAPAAFLGLLAPRLRAGKTERLIAIAGALVALATTPLFPPGVPVLLSALVIVPVLVRHRPPKEKA